jgi:hypothetical protein
MLEQEFTLVLASDPGEDDADRLYAAFQDGTISTIAGVPRIDFHRGAETLVAAIRSAIDDVRGAGFEVLRVEIEPAAVAPSN